MLDAAVKTTKAAVTMLNSYINRYTDKKFIQRAEDIADIYIPELLFEVAKVLHDASKLFFTEPIFLLDNGNFNAWRKEWLAQLCVELPLFLRETSTQILHGEVITSKPLDLSVLRACKPRTAPRSLPVQDRRCACALLRPIVLWPTALCRFLKQPKLLESFMHIVAAAYLQYTALR
jgi:hypothetical protein